MRRVELIRDTEPGLVAAGSLPSVTPWEGRTRRVYDGPLSESNGDANCTDVRLTERLFLRFRDR